MNTYYVAGIPYSDELFHHGIKGQKWGIRRYQNPDGTYTSEGKARYGAKNDRQASSLAKYQNKEYEKAKAYYDLNSKMYDKRIEKLTGKRDKALSNLNLKKAMRISNKMKFNEERKAHDKKIGEQVLKDIKNMTVKDMNRENRENISLKYAKQEIFILNKRKLKLYHIR